MGIMDCISIVIEGVQKFIVVIRHARARVRNLPRGRMVAVLFGLGSLVFVFQGYSVSPALGDEFLVGVGMLRHFFNFPDAIPGVGRVIIGSPFGQFLFVLHIGWILGIHLL